jgi:hypothetical protein
MADEFFEKGCLVCVSTPPPPPPPPHPTHPTQSHARATGTLARPRRAIAAAITTDDDSEHSEDIDHQLKKLLTFNERGGIRRGLRKRYFSTVKVDVSKFRQLVLGRVHQNAIIIIAFLYCIRYITTLNADYTSRSRLHRRQH